MLRQVHLCRSKRKDFLPAKKLYLSSAIPGYINSEVVKSLKGSFITLCEQNELSLDKPGTLSGVIWPLLRGRWETDYMMPLWHGFGFWGSEKPHRMEMSYLIDL